MNHPRPTLLRSYRTTLLALCISVLSSATALAKDTITDANNAQPIITGPSESPAISNGDFVAGGPYTIISGPDAGSTVTTVDLFLGSGTKSEWWVNGSQSSPWSSPDTANNYFAYHNREDIPAGGSFFAAWSFKREYFDYTSSNRHTGSQIPNGSIFSIGLSNNGSPVVGNWNESVDGAFSETDVPGGIDLSTYSGPPASAFSSTAAFEWKSYEVNSGGGDITWTISKPVDNNGDPLPMTDYVVFVQLPPGVSLDADGGSYTTLSANTMQGLGATDEIVFNWTIDAKNNNVGELNTTFGQNVGGNPPCDIEFQNDSGGTAAYQVGDSIYLEVTDEESNTNSGSPDTVTVTLENQRTGETEVITLNETGNDTNVFTFAGGFPTTDTGNTGNDSGTLNVQEGDTISATALSGGDGTPCTITYRFPVATDIVKSVDKANANVSDTLTYTMDVNYPAADILNNVVVSDSAPAGTTIVGGSANAGGVIAGSDVSWDLGSTVAGTFNNQSAGLGTFSSLEDLTNDFGSNDSGFSDLVIDGNGFQHLVFVGQSGSDSKENIYYINNTTGSWSPPLRVSSDNFNQNAFTPSLAVDSSGNAHVSYLHKKDVNPKDDNVNAYYVKVTSGVAGTPQRLSSDNENALFTDIAVSGNNVHVVFNEKQSGDSKVNVYYTVSTNSGTSFSSSEQVSTFDDQDALNPAIAASGSSVDIVYTDKSGSDNRRNVYHVTGTSGSLGSPTRLSDDTDGQDALGPDVALNSSGDAMVVYTDKQSGDGNRNVYFTTDGGGSFSTPQSVSDGYAGEDSSLPAIAVDGQGYAHVVFNNKGTDGDKLDIAYANNQSGFFDTPVQITTDLGNQNSLNPAIAADINSVCIAFGGMGDSDNNRNIYNTCVDINVGTRISISASPSIATTGDTVTVTAVLESTEDLTGVLPVITPGATNNMGLSLQTSPSAMDLTADSPTLYTWTYTVTEGSNATPGQLTFGVTATNNDATYGLVDFGNASSNSLIATPPLEFKVTIDNGTTGPILNVASVKDDGNDKVITGNPVCYLTADEDDNDNDSDTLLKVEMVNGSPVVSVVGATGTTHLEAMVWSPDYSAVYVTNRASGFSGSDNFGTLNLSTGAFSAIGRVASTSAPLEGTALGNFTTLDIDGMAFDPISGDLYAVSRRETSGNNTLEDLLLKIDPATGLHVEDAFGAGEDYVVLDTSPLSVYDIDDIAFDPVSGVLYGVANSPDDGSGADDRLVTINTSTGAITDIDRLTTADGGDDIDDMEGLSFDADGTLHATTGNDGNNNTNNKYWTIDPDTGVATEQIDLTEVQSQAFSGYEDYEAVACRTAPFVYENPLIPPTDSNEVTTTLGSTIGDFVWIDSDGDGLQDPGETGLNGVTVRRLSADGSSVLDTTTTVTNGGQPGYYEFTGVPDGDYLIEFITPGDYVFSPQDNPTGGTNDDSDANPSNGRAAVNVAGADDLTIDAGMYEPVEISGLVQFDNGGGNQPLPGVTLNLLDGTGAPVLDDLNQPITTTTNGSGAYTFEDLPPGTYRISQDQPDGYQSTSDTDGANNNVIGDQTTITLTSGQSSSGNNFLEQQLGSISGMVEADTTGDGDGDTGLGGVTLTLLDENGSPILDGGNLITTVTSDGTIDVDGDGNVDPIGEYAFTNLLPDDYQVAETQPAGYRSVRDADGGDLDLIGDPTPITVTAGADSGSNDFVEEEYGSISGIVEADTTGDNTGDTGLGGVTLTLLDENGNPVLDGGNPITTVTSDGTVDVDGDGNADPIGEYAFTGLVPDNYQVAETQPAGYSSVSDSDGGDPDLIGDPTPITVTAGADSGNNNFVEAIIPGIFGQVRYDTDMDGVLSDTEVGIPGITIELRDENYNIVSTTVTDADGNYAFPNVATGINYWVVEVDPVGYTSSNDFDGGNSFNVSRGRVNVVSALAAYTDNDFLDYNLAGCNDTDEYAALNIKSVQGGVTYPLTGSFFHQFPGGLNATETSTFTFEHNRLPTGRVIEADWMGDVTFTYTQNDSNATSGASHFPGERLTEGTTDFNVGSIPNRSGTIYTVYGRGGFSFNGNGTVNHDWTVTYDFTGLGGANGYLPAGTLIGFVDIDGIPVDGESVLANAVIAGGGSGPWLAYEDDAPNPEPGHALALYDAGTNSYYMNGPDSVQNDSILFRTTQNLTSITLDITQGTVGGSIGMKMLAPVVDTPCIEGTVRNDDEDKDDTLDGDEPGIGGVIVTLWTDPDMDGDPSDGYPVATTVTDENGDYDFPMGPAGSYVIVETDPSGAVSDDDEDGDTTNTANEIGITVDGINSSVDHDFLDDTAAIYNLSGFVYDDGDTPDDSVLGAGGAPGTGDTPEPDYRVNLYLDANGNGVAESGEFAGTAITLSDGSYEFEGLAPGDYLVFLERPVGIVSEDDVSNGTATSASDGRVYSTIVNADSTENNFLVDQAELYSISGLVEYDNGAGKQPLPGVTINLLDSGGAPVLDDLNQPITTMTEADGSYIFEGLPSGIYRVSQDQPAGYESVSDTDGSNNNVIGDQTPITLTSGQSSTGNNFLEQQLGAITGFVLVDENNNGIGDSGLGGVTVTLKNSAGDDIDSDPGPGFEPTIAVTDPTTGKYTFGNLPPGSYQVVQTHPAGYNSVGDTDGANNDTIGDENLIVVAAGATNDGNNFIEELPNSIGDFVFLDLDGNGEQGGPGEVGVNGVLVRLLDADNGNAEVATVLTSGGGAYLFEDLTPGNYVIDFVPPSGFDLTTKGSGTATDSDADQTTGETDSIAITRGDAIDDIDAGLVSAATGSIGDTVWLDEDGNGIQDAGEPGIPNVPVALTIGGTTVNTVTDANGRYVFDGLEAGNYTVTVNSGNPPTGLTLTKDPDGTANNAHDVTLASGEDYVDADFGYNWVGSGDTDTPGTTTEGAIGDRIWSDADGDGVQDPGESGIEGILVKLYTDPDGDGVYDTEVASDTTDSFGNYLFPDLDPGSYVVEVTNPPAGSNQTGDPDGTDDDKTTSPVVLAPGDVFVNADFGYQIANPASIGDTIYLDVDASGDYNGAVDTGIAGVTVNLLNASGDIIATTTTNENGFYEFPGLLTGVGYSVEVTDLDGVLAGLALTGDPEGAADGAAAVASLTADIDTFDFGYAPVGHGAGDGLIGDTVYIDTDNNGALTTGEGVEGVTVTLWNSDNTVILATTTTDANGNYLFGGLDASASYNVVVDNSGILNGLTNFDDPDTVGSGDHTSLIDLSSTGPADLDQDFGYNGGANSISGLVWEDPDANGTRAGSETTRFDGVTVSLTDSDGNVVATTTTAVDGSYSFSNLPDGDFTVEVTDTDNVLDGHWHSLGTDSAPDPTTVTLNSGNTSETLDFGYYIDPATVGDLVWLDLDADGIQDGGEPGLPGVVVTMTVDYPNGATVTATTITGTDGSYSFDALVDEDYAASGTAGGGLPVITITAQAPAGFISSPIGAGGNDTDDSDNPVTGEVAEAVQGADDPSNDFGFYQGATIGNRIWLDENSDGVQDAGESGLAGIVVELLDGGGSPILDGGVPVTATTDVDGGYIFTGLVPGNYQVRVAPASVPTELDAYTYDPQGSVDGIAAVTVASGDEIMTLDFGLNYSSQTETDTPPQGTKGAIGDRVWNDADGDGVQDPNEAGIGGVTVELFSDPNGDGVYDFSEGTRVTAPDGSYIFADIDHGAYVVEVSIPPVGWTQTGDPDGTLDGATTNPIVLGPGDVFLGADFGYDLPGGADIGDTIYLDTNANGALDGGEPGIAGVTVSLLDAAGKVIATDTTDSNGKYLFPGVPSGAGADYTVVVTDTDNVLGELVQSGDPDGVKDAKSSIDDLDAGGNLDQDFGYLPAGHGPGEGIIGDLVFLDIDGSGSPDAGEGLEGVTVILKNSGGTVIATTTTSENGGYTFGGLDPNGTYTVEIDPTTLPAGVSNTVDPDAPGAGDNSSTVDLSTTGGVNLTRDFGYEGSNDISGTVWEDTDAEGDLDETGTGFGGVTVALIDSDGDIIATTTTLPDGSYAFDNLPDGTFTVDVTDEAGVLTGYWHSLGTDSDPDPTDVTVGPGNTSGSADFGYYRAPASIGNFVWSDLDGNGVQGGTEPGIAGALVTLTVSYPNGDSLTMSTTTDSSGEYRFDNLLLDESFAAAGGVGEPVFTVTVATPGGMTATQTGQGNATNDSSDPIAGETADNLTQGGSDLTLDFGFVSEKEANFASWQTENPLGGQNGVADNPDGDLYSNLIEYAFCLDPDSGIGSPFCLEPRVGSGYDLVFHRRLGSLSDVEYCVLYIDDLANSTASPTSWTEYALDSLPGSVTVTVTPNGDGASETVTLSNIDALGASGATRGFFTLAAKLDTNNDNTADAIHFTDVQGFQRTTIEQNECETYANPFLSKPVFSGKVEGVTGNNLEFGVTTNQGLDFTPGASGPILESGVSYYVEILTGDLKGHRLDISTGGSGFVTIASDDDLCAGDPYSTLLTNVSLPVGLNGAEIMIVEHLTLNDIAPPEAFVGSNDSANADRVLVPGNLPSDGTGGWSTYFVFDHATDPDYWVLQGGGPPTDKGGVVIPPCQGFFLHPKSQEVTLETYGMVRENSFACPLWEGSNLIAAAYPIDLSPDDLELNDDGTVNPNVEGSGDPANSDQIYLWKRDGVSATDTDGYTAYWYVDNGLTGPSQIQRWARVGDLSLSDRSGETFLLGNRSFFLRSGDDRASYRYKQPWTSLAPVNPL